MAIEIKNSYLKEDLESISNSNQIEWGSFKDKNILITGATGLIGSLIIKSLLYTSAKSNLDIKVYALIRDVNKANEIYSEFQGEIIQGNLVFITGEITEPIKLDNKIDYIIHAASPTASKFFVSNPVETIDSIVIGTKNIFEFAKNNQVQGAVYISSMEVYGTCEDKVITEEDLGYIDPLSIRSSYPEGKRLAECMSASYAAEYGLPITIARLAQTFGPGILKTENRVFSQFAKSVINKSDIVLHTEGKSEGNYCYSSDAVVAVLLLLTKGEGGQAYTVVNEETHTTIIDMARMVAKEFANNEIQVIIDLPEDANTYGFAKDVKLRLSSDKLRGLGWKPNYNLKEAYFRLIESMKEEL